MYNQPTRPATYMVRLPHNGEAYKTPFDADNSLAQLQSAIGGWIEACPIPTVKCSPDYAVTCFVDEEGLLKRLRLNHRLSEFVGGFIVGDAVFVGTDNMGVSVGLSEEDADALVSRLNALKPHTADLTEAQERIVIREFLGGGHM